MQFRHGEVELRIIRRHKTPYIIKLIQICLVSLPVYVLLFIIAGETNTEWTLILIGILSLFVGAAIMVFSLDYLLDKLIITNMRVIWINWKSIFTRNENETEFIDIQDIEIKEKGILAKIPFFNYGFLRIATASTQICIDFKDCPHPKEIKNYILNQTEKLRGGIYEKREPLKKDEEWSVN